MVKEKAGGDSYEVALAALSSLITKRSRADKSNKGDRFELVFDYLKVSLFQLDSFRSFDYFCTSVFYFSAEYYYAFAAA